MKPTNSQIGSYLATLTEEQRAIIEPLRTLILGNLPVGMEESLSWGMLSYEIPLSRYPHTYNKQPLLYAAFGPKKHYYSLYIMPAYMDEAKFGAIQQANKKLSIGKSCIRFKKLEDLPLDSIASLINSYTVDSFIEAYEKTRIK